MPSDTPFLFGISEFTTDPLTFEEDVALYADGGAGAMEIAEDKLDPARWAEQMALPAGRGLRVTSVQPSVRTLFPSQGQPAPLPVPERLALFRRTIERLAPHAPGASFVCNTGIPPGGDVQQVLDTAVQEYGPLADFAAQYGARVALEPLSPFLANVESSVWTVRDALRVIDAVGRENFGLCLDVWNSWQDADLAGAIREAGPRIFVVHIGDWRTPRSYQDRVLPGQGVIPLAAFLRDVRRTGYAGAYTVEIFSNPALPDSLWKADPRRVVEDSRHGLEAAWRQSFAP